jgi:chemotaxis protein MotB
MARAIQKGEIIMQAFKTAILATSLAALAGCASLDQSPICNPSHQWTAWSDVRCNADNTPKATDDSASRLAALEKERHRLADELAAAQKQNGALSSRVSDLEGQLNQSKGGLAKAEKDLLKALQPEISKGAVSVNQSGDALTINLASGLLFASGQDQLKAGGADALKRVGGVLKDFPDKQVHVAGYTDNVAITGALQKKFPSNKELSDARAYSAARALRDGGVSTNLSAAGHGDSNPIASNNTPAGRAKNRRVEVIVK